MTQNKEKTGNSIPRPPIVVVMGHIDHGKTTLLDYIRKASIAAGETGGITQHISAYQAGLKIKGNEPRTVTFLDTPGHEAFTKMRTRGAKVADIAVLVVAADDGVKPQTKEALETLHESKIPYVVAVNKIDKAGVDAEKTVRDLAEANVFLEGKGGNVPWVAISAKEGTGVDELLETVLLLADLEESKADFGKAAEGVVLEAHLDQKRGVAATLLLKDGTFKKGDWVLAGNSLAKARIAEDFKGENLAEAFPSMPVVVVGFDVLPAAGSVFKSFSSKKEAEEAQKVAKTELGAAKAPLSAAKAPLSAAKAPLSAAKAPLSAAKAEPSPAKAAVSGDEEPKVDVVTFGIVIKADTLGSAEAVEHEIRKLESEKVRFKFLRELSGDLSEDDINLASSAEHPVALAFRSAVSPEAKELAEKLGVKMAQFSIIYEIVDFLREHLSTVVPEEEELALLGKAKVLKTFSRKGKNQIIGGRVEEGILTKGNRVNILRRDNKIGEGKINNIQQNKLDTAKVVSPSEFGAVIESSFTISPGDSLQIYA